MNQIKKILFCSTIKRIIMQQKTENRISVNCLFVCKCLVVQCFQNYSCVTSIYASFSNTFYFVSMKELLTIYPTSLICPALRGGPLDTGGGNIEKVLQQNNENK